MSRHPLGVRDLLCPALCAVLMLAPVTMPVPVLRGLVQERFAVGDFATSLFMAINMVGAFLAAPLVGMLADRVGATRRLIAGALALDAACLLGLTAPLPFALFLGVRLLEGCAHIAALSLLLAHAGALSRDEGRARALGAVGAGITLGVALGAPLGGALGRSDVLLPLRVGAGVLLAAALLAAVTLRPRPARRPAGLGTMLAAVRREADLWVPLAYAFVDRFTVGFFTTAFPLYLRNVHGLTPPQIGILLGAFLLPFALGSYPCARLAERYSRMRLLAGGSLAYGLLVTGVGAVPLPFLPVAMVVLGVLSAVMFVPSLLLATDLAPDAIRATALGGFNAAGSLGFLLGPIVAGSVSEFVGAATTPATGYALAFVVAGAAEVLCVAWTWPRLQRLRAEGRTT